MIVLPEVLVLAWSSFTSNMKQKMHPATLDPPQFEISLRQRAFPSPPRKFCLCYALLLDVHSTHRLLAFVRERNIRNRPPSLLPRATAWSGVRNALFSGPSLDGSACLLDKRRFCCQPLTNTSRLVKISFPSKPIFTMLPLTFMLSRASSR